MNEEFKSMYKDKAFWITMIALILILSLIIQILKP
jgi:hypothetical protein